MLMSDALAVSREKDGVELWETTLDESMGLAGAVVVETAVVVAVTV